MTLARLADAQVARGSAADPSKEFLECRTTQGPVTPHHLRRMRLLDLFPVGTRTSIAANNGDVTVQRRRHRGVRDVRADERPILPPRYRGWRPQHPAGRQESWASHKASGRSITAPDPLLDVIDHARPHWVQDDVAARLEKVRIVLNELGLEGPVEEVPNAPVPLVPPLRVLAVQVL